MMLMVSCHAQGIAGKVSGSLCQLVEGSLQVVELLPLVPCLLPVEALSVPLVSLHGGDK
jgi:hypothetical protein